MNDVIANRIASFRARLTCLDKEAHVAIWQNQPPLKFTEKVEQARTLTATLIARAGLQSAPVTGNATTKRRVGDDLENDAYKLGRAMVSYGRDTGNDALAERYDLRPSGWGRLRKEALIQRARLLEQEIRTAATGPNAATATAYGLTVAAADALDAEITHYDELIAVPRDAIAERSVLTASLREESRLVSEKFDEVADLLPQFGNTPAGKDFVAAYLAASVIVDLGHGPRPKAPDGENGPTDPSAPPAPTPDTPPAG